MTTVQRSVIHESDCCFVIVWGSRFHQKHGRFKTVSLAIHESQSFESTRRYPEQAKEHAQMNTASFTTRLK